MAINSHLSFNNSKCKHELIFVQHIQGTTYKVNDCEVISGMVEHVSYRVKCRQCQYDRNFKYTVDFPAWLTKRMKSGIMKGIEQLTEND